MHRSRYTTPAAASSTPDLFGKVVCPKPCGRYTGRLWRNAYMVSFTGRSTGTFRDQAAEGEHNWSELSSHMFFATLWMFGGITSCVPMRSDTKNPDVCAIFVHVLRVFWCAAYVLAGERQEDQAVHRQASRRRRPIPGERPPPPLPALLEAKF